MESNLVVRKDPDCVANCLPPCLAVSALGLHAVGPPRFNTEPRESGQHLRLSHVYLQIDLVEAALDVDPCTAESRLCKRHVFVTRTGRRESLLAEPWAIMNPLQSLQWSIGTCSSKICWAARSLVGLAAIVVPSDRMMAAGPALLTPKTKQNDLAFRSTHQ